MEFVITARSGGCRPIRPGGCPVNAETRFSDESINKLFCPIVLDYEFNLIFSVIWFPHIIKYSLSLSLPVDVVKLVNHVNLLSAFIIFTFDYLFLFHVRYNTSTFELRRNNFNKCILVSNFAYLIECLAIRL